MGADPSITRTTTWRETGRDPGNVDLMIIGAGLEKNPVPRYMFERLGKLLGSGVAARTAIVLITSILFGLVHYSVQGLSGAEQGTIVGLVYGAIFAVTAEFGC